jgi:hypothetical protein
MLVSEVGGFERNEEGRKLWDFIPLQIYSFSIRFHG